MKRCQFTVIILLSLKIIFSFELMAEGNGIAFQKGVNAYMAGNFSGAIKDLLQSLTENPENFDAYYYLGMSYSAVQKTDDAYFTFKRSLDLNNKKDNLVPEVYASMMRIQTDKFNYSATEKLGLYALKNGYKSVNLFFELARAYLFKKEYVKSQKAIDLALEMDPINPYTYNLQCLLYMSRGMVNSAITAAQTAIAFKNDIHFFYANLAAAYERAGNYQKAVSSYQDALKYAPNDQMYIQSLKRNQWLLSQQNAPTNAK